MMVDDERMTDRHYDCPFCDPNVFCVIAPDGRAMPILRRHVNEVHPQVAREPIWMLTLASRSVL